MGDRRSDTLIKIKLIKIKRFHDRRANRFSWQAAAGSERGSKLADWCGRSQPPIVGGRHCGSHRLNWRALPPEIVAKGSDEAALPGLAEPRDIAEVVLFLLSDAGRAIAGEVLPVHAGQYI